MLFIHECFYVFENTSEMRKFWNLLRYASLILKYVQ